MGQDNTANRSYGSRRFEARIINQRVRESLDAGDENTTGYDDAWANHRYVEICADSMTDAKERLDADYPAEAGFMITAIIELRARD